MLSIIQNIPNINAYPLPYVFENMKIQHKPNTLWLEFGVASGNNINYISQFTNDIVYGFDKRTADPSGNLPQVNSNVELVNEWSDETLINFMQTQNKKVSFIHMDVDMRSSTKYIFDVLKEYIDTDCIIIFDELVNYPGFEDGELKAFYEFITENKVEYTWIGMDGTPTGMLGYFHQNVALIIHSIN